MKMIRLAEEKIISSQESSSVPSRAKLPNRSNSQLAFAIALTLSNSPIYGATITADGTTCTLADAITAANTDAVSGGCSAGSGDDTINITNDVTLSARLPFIKSNLILEGNNHFVDGASTYRVFFTKTGNVTFSNLTIQNGQAKGGDGNGGGGGGAGLGAGLFIYDGIITIDNVTFSNNSAIGGNGASGFLGGGGGMRGNGGTGGGGGFGGNGGNRDINNDGGGDGGGINIGDNGANGDNGGLDGSYGGGGGGSDVSGGHGGFGGGGGGGGKFGGGGGEFGGGGGGGDDSDGGFGGGGGFNGFGGSGSGGGAGFGGAIFAMQGTTILIDVSFSGNTTTAGSGGSSATDGTADGNDVFICTSTQDSACSATVNQCGTTNTSKVAGGSLGNCQGQVVYVSGTGNDSTGDGSSGSSYATITKAIQEVADGGIVNMAAGTYLETTMITIDKNVTITGDSTASTIIDGNNHHPLFKINFGKTVEMNDLTIRNGLADDVVNSILQNDGGGVNNGGTLTLNNCTISNNTAKTGGGGIANGGTLTLNNSTVSGNEAQTNSGGGIRNSGTLTLNNSTVSNNAAPNGDGGGINNFGTTLTLKNALIAGNTSADNQDVTGTIDTNTTSCLGSDCTANDGQAIASISWLDNLGSNGGSTQTHALLTGAPATVVDAGDASTCALAAINNTDQRGETRPSGQCDVGAYEASKITITTGTTPVEGGDVGTFTIDLTPELPANESLTINYSTTGGTATISDDYEIGSSEPSVTFNTNSLTITDPFFAVSKITLDIPAQDDAIDENAEMVKITLTSANNGYIIAPGSDNATLTITDNDTAGLTLSKTTASVNESGTTDTFTVKLDSQPINNVELSLSSSDTDEATISPTTLTFTPTNWNSTQTATVTGVDDISTDGDQNTTVTISVVDVNSDDKYDPLTDKTVNVTTVDNDVPGITVNPTNLTISENGSSTFTVKLNTQPSSSSADVSIAFFSASNSECSVSPTTTTIANANWNSGTIFTVTATDDTIVDGAQTCTIQIGTSTSSDGDYNNLDPDDVTVTVQDNDIAGITQTSSNITIAEGGASSYNISLNTQPSGNVEITVTADAQTEISSDGNTFGSTLTLTFTNSNWNSPQAITVQAIDDATVEGNHTSTIIHAITGTVNDANYPHFLSLGNVTANITDNDNPPASIPSTPPSQPLPSSMSLTVKMAGNGFGNVKSNPSGIDCTRTQNDEDTVECKHSFDTATWMTLEANAANGSEFDYFSGHGDCSKDKIFLTSNLSCTAYFKLGPRTLTISGVEHGTVSSSPAGIVCSTGGDQCSHLFEGGKTVTLTAKPDEGWLFDGWEAPCHESVTLTHNLTCQPQWVPAPATPENLQLSGSDGNPTNTINLGTTTNGTPITQNIIFKNTGLTALPLSEFTLPEGFRLVGDLPDNLVAGETLTLPIQLDFTKVGSYEGKLVVKVDGKPVEFPISGTVTPACPDASRLYVNQHAQGSNTGCNWIDAMTDLQAALQPMANGWFSQVTEIWLAKGVYQPTRHNDRTASFQLVNGVSIYGGFAGNESNLSARNSSENQTILTGNIGIPNESNDNSYHVVTGSGTDNSTMINGVLITGGNAQAGDSCPDACGGGIYNDNGSPTLEYVMIQDNAAVYGGGLYNGNQSQPMVKYSFLTNNTASADGGGLFNRNSSPVLKHVFIQGNTAQNEGGGIANRQQAKPVFSQVNLSGNTAQTGGGLLNDDSSPLISHTIISDNVATNGGGIVNLNQSAPQLSHLIVSGNLAENLGGAILNKSSHLVMNQTTVTENTAPTGSGLVNESSQVKIANSILWENHPVNATAQAQIIDDASSQTTVNYSIVQNGFPGEGNQDIDPLFAESIVDHITTHTTVCDFHLTAHSPAIDAGKNDLIPLDFADAECRGADDNVNEVIELVLCQLYFDG